MERKGEKEMLLKAGVIYKNAESNYNAQPVLLRNPNTADLLIGLHEVVGVPTASSQLDNIGHTEDVYAIVDMLKSVDYVAVTADCNLVGLNLVEL